MSGWDDLPDEMRGEWIDGGTSDRLLRGRVAPDDAPPGYSDVASVLLAVASQPVQEELSMQVQHISAARDAIGRRTHRRRPGPLGITAGLIVVGTLLVLPGLAAANVLPSPAQHAVSRMLDKVGISVPAGAQHTTGSSVDHPASTGAEISSLATTTDATGVAKGAEISTLASGGMSQAGQHGKAADATHGTPSNTAGQGTAAAAAGDRGAHGLGRSSTATGGAAPTHP